MQNVQPFPVPPSIFLNHHFDSAKPRGKSNLLLPLKRYRSFIARTKIRHLIPKSSMSTDASDIIQLSALATAFQEQQSGPGALWAEITALSRQPGVVDIGQGYPDFGSNVIAKQSAKRAISMDEKTISGDVPDARANQYAPIPGTKDMLDAVKRYYRETAKNVSSVDETRDTSLVTTSATEAL